MLSWINQEHYGVVCGDQEDTAVVYNKLRFHLIKAVPTNIRAALYTLVELKDKQTDTVFCAISAHLTGCDPIAPTREDAQVGNEQLDFILKQLEMAEKESKADVTLFGLDAKIPIQEYPKRIGKLQENKYEADHSLIPTNTCGIGENKGRLAKIDHICIRSIQKN